MRRHRRVSSFLTHLSNRRQTSRLSRQRFALLFFYRHVLIDDLGELHPFVRFAPRALYGILIRAAWQALREVAAVPRLLGAEPGAMAVLHTWTQRLQLHPHVYLVVPGGSLDESGRWRASSLSFLVPVRALSQRFAHHFVGRLERAISR